MKTELSTYKCKKCGNTFQGTPGVPMGCGRCNGRAVEIVKGIVTKVTTGKNKGILK